MPLPIEPGQVIAGKYKVERVLGEGGMGVVLMAYDLRLERTVAIKFLLPELARQKEAAARFLREARACVKIQSEHIARVIDVDVLPDETPYMVMEYIEGRDLERTITERGALPVSDVALWVIQACEAIAEAHAQRIVHRDLKPANLFLARQTGGSESVKVLDFGISKQAAAHGPSPSLTRTSAMLGSPLYMSPEQMRSTRDVDSRTDIWALGAILHEALCGRPPFEGESIPQLSAQILLDEPARVDALRPEVPKVLADIVWRALRKDPAERFTNVGELALALMPFAHKRAHNNLERIQRTLVASGLMAEPVSLSDAPTAGAASKAAVRITGHEATVPPSAPAPAPGSVEAPSAPARALRSVPPKGRTMGNFGQTSDGPKHGSHRWRWALGLAALLGAGGAGVVFWPYAAKALRPALLSALASALSSEPPRAAEPAVAAAPSTPATTPAAPAVEVRVNATGSEATAAVTPASAAEPTASATVTLDNEPAAAPSGADAPADDAALTEPAAAAAAAAPAASSATPSVASKAPAKPTHAPRPTRAPPRAAGNASSASTSTTTSTRRVQTSETTTYSGTFKSKFGSRK